MMHTAHTYDKIKMDAASRIIAHESIPGQPVGFGGIN